MRAKRPELTDSSIGGDCMARTYATPEEREADLAKRKAAREAERAERKAAYLASRTHGEDEVRSAIKAGAKQAALRLIEGKRTGRPSVMSEHLEAIILERVANGESLASITADADMPSAATVLRHAAKVPSFDQALARARLCQADVLVDQCLAIADDTTADLLPKGGEDGGVTINTLAVTRAKLRIDTRLRLAGQINPSRYAERITAPAGPVTVNVNTLAVDARAMTPEQRDRLKSVLLEARAMPVTGPDD